MHVMEGTRMPSKIRWWLLSEVARAFEVLAAGTSWWTLNCQSTNHLPFQEKHFLAA
jgi:hypothetical protein